jgi:hypothetical protein
MIGPDAAGTVIANNWIYLGAGYGIHNHGATGTAITNNAVRSRCPDGIRVDGASSTVSVRNNVLVTNGHFGQTYCQGGPTGAWSSESTTTPSTHRYRRPGQCTVLATVAAADGLYGRKTDLIQPPAMDQDTVHPQLTATQRHHHS